MIFDLLDLHPMTTDQFVRFGIFPSRDRAQKRLMRLVQRRKIPFVGTAMIQRRGRPETVFCRWRPKYDNLRHEVLLTEFLLRLTGAKIVRGYETDRTFRADAEVTLDGILFYVEMDCGTMKYRDIINKRFRKYVNCENVVLWISNSEARRDGLLRRAECVKGCSLFASLPDTLREPFGRIWTAFDGRTEAIGKGDRKSVLKPLAGAGV